METVKLGDICEIVSGGTPSRSKPEYWKDGTIPWIKIGNIKCKYVREADEFITEEGLKGSSAKMLPKGTLLYTIFATLGEVGILDINACTNQAIAGITIKDPKKINTDYLYYFLQSKKQFVNDLGRGVAQNNINMSILRGFELTLPSYEDQHKKVHIFDKVSSIISARQQELLALDDLIKARFVEMFGDVIQNNMQWPKYLFSDIASSRLGKMLDAKQQTGKWKYPYLANFNVQWFHFELDNLNEMDFNEADQAEFELKDGDLLVCEGGEIGRCAVWHCEVKPCYFQKALHRVRCKDEFVLPDYLARWFQYNCNHGGFSSIEGAKATIAHLPGAKLKELQVVVPPLELQKEFVKFSAQVDKSKFAVQKALNEAQTLFDSLMQQYFGQS